MKCYIVCVYIYVWYVCVCVCVCADLGGRSGRWRSSSGDWRRCTVQGSTRHESSSPTVMPSHCRASVATRSPKRRRKSKGKGKTNSSNSSRSIHNPKSNNKPTATTIITKQRQSSRTTRMAILIVRMGRRESSREGTIVQLMICYIYVRGLLC